ncbi:MAG: MBL fold metallo-hydrolase [Pseudomonadota bacterium]|nr:MBL fold metallo-hydrolase [Pseudomonadota bacterium]
MIALLLVACASSDPGAWRAGELVVEQIGLAAGTIGEAALIVGPDGTSVLLDVGNDAHAGAVRDAVVRHLGEPRVDWIVLTHFHADHVGAMDELDVAVGSGVITRGPYDLDPEAANADEWAEVAALRGTLPFVDLCEGPEEAPADISAGGPWPAGGCAGLAGAGDSDGIGIVPLGEGAALRVIVGDGFTATDHAEVGADENARSLGGTIRWGDFSYWWGGDLTGGGKGTPDVEGWLATALDPSDLPAEGVDVAHLHHHGISSSTSAAWVDRLLPDGGGDRHVVIGATGSYLSAPSEDALTMVSDRLGAGSAWATETGWTAGNDPRLVVAHGGVLVRVSEGGDRCSVEADGSAAACGG